jgi:O-antigen ligase
LRTASSFARVEASKDAIALVSESPIIGVGFNAYRYALVEYDLRDEVVQTSNADAGTDNSYLFVLATTGIIGLLIFLDFWFNILKRVYFAPVVFASVVGLLVNTLFINSIFFSPIMAWIFLLVGVTLNKKR